MDRLAIYVYSKAEVTVAPDAPVDFMRMADDYSAKFEATVSAPVTVTLNPGVYGYVYSGAHGFTAPDGVVTVVAAKIDPWPKPPPPPPPPFIGRRDWADHVAVFLV